jgi:cytochrome c peroxidase
VGKENEPPWYRGTSNGYPADPLPPDRSKADLRCMFRPAHSLLVLGLAAVLALGCRRDEALPDGPGTTHTGPTPLALNVPDWAVDSVHGLNLPWDNPLTVEGVALGRMLFYEKALSNDYSMSCATCHRQEHAFSDPRQFSVGTDGTVGRRNSMSVMNLAWDHFFFRDARAFSLELQALRPVVDHAEMRNTWPVVEQRLAADPRYPPLFQKAFGSPHIDSLRVVFAIAQFERTLLSFNSRFDRYYYGGEQFALTDQERRGMDLFFGEAHCDCHMLPHFKDANVQNIGLPPGPTIDAGLMEVSGLPEHRNRFKNVSLRNIAVTAPYMHDGRFATLEEVVDFYADDVQTQVANLDAHMAPWVWGQIDLDAQERADLVAFMMTLTDHEFLTNPAFSDPHP